MIKSQADRVWGFSFWGLGLSDLLLFDVLLLQHPWDPLTSRGGVCL